MMVLLTLKVLHLLLTLKVLALLTLRLERLLLTLLVGAVVVKVVSRMSSTPTLEIRKDNLKGKPKAKPKKEVSLAKTWLKNFKKTWVR